PPRINGLPAHALPPIKHRVEAPCTKDGHHFDKAGSESHSRDWRDYGERHYHTDSLRTAGFTIKTPMMLRSIQLLALAKATEWTNVSPMPHQSNPKTPMAKTRETV